MRIKTKDDRRQRIKYRIRRRVSGSVERPRLTIFRVPDPRPLLTGPGEANVLRFGHDQVVVATGATGTYRLGVRFSPYWHASAGCLAKGADGMLRLTTTRPGRVTLRFESGLGAIVRHLAGDGQNSCPAATKNPA